MLLCGRHSATRCKAVRFQLFLHSRKYSGPVISSGECIRLPRHDGEITLDVYHPVTTPPTRESSHGVLVYLPRGPFLANAEHEASTISTLRSVLPFHIVQVNYRLSGTHLYPTPVHDVLAGYDWILQNLVTNRQYAGRKHTDGLAVCGEFVGGSLATALALTECRRGSVGIVGAALNNAVFDWTSLDEQQATKEKRWRRGEEASTLQTKRIDVRKEMLSLRKQFFRRPEHYFDPFVSPIHFFRAAGREVPPPPAPPPKDDMEFLSMLEREQFYREQLTLNIASAENSPDPDPNIGVPYVKKQKSSLRFPSAVLGLQLPAFYVSAGIDTSLSESAAELVHQLRQSYVRQSREQFQPGFGRKILTEEEQADDEEHMQWVAEAEKKGLLEINPGIGLWDDSVGGRNRLYHAAQWLKNIML